MPELKRMMKQALIVAVTAAALFIGYAYVGAYAQGFSIELALRHIIYLGQFQPVLGELLTGIPLGVAAAIAFSALRLQPAVPYIVLSAVATVVASFVIVPSWPSGNLVRVIGELVYMLTVGLAAWAVLKALTLHSRGTR